MIINKFARFASDGRKYLYNRGWVDGVTWSGVAASAAATYASSNISVTDQVTNIIVGSATAASIKRSAYYLTSADVTGYTKACVQVSNIQTSAAEADVAGTYFFAGYPRPYYNSGWNSGIKQKIYGNSVVFEIDISSLSGSQEVGFAWIEEKNGIERVTVERVWLESAISPIIPQMSSDSQGGFVASTDGESEPNNEPYKAFDGDDNTFWYSNIASVPKYLKIALPEAKTVSRVTFKVGYANGTTGCAGTVQAAVGGSWQDIASFSTNAKEIKDYDVDITPITSSEFRVNFTQGAIYDGGTYLLKAVWSFQLYGV